MIVTHSYAACITAMAVGVATADDLQVERRNRSLLVSCYDIMWRTLYLPCLCSLFPVQPPPSPSPLFSTCNFAPFLPIVSS